MQLSRPVKILVGVLTLWPMVYILLFMAFVFGSMIWTARAHGGEHSAGLPVAFLLVFAAHFGTMLLMFGLTAFYIVYLFKTDRVPQDKKALWAAVLFLGNMIAMPVFFYLYIWPEQWAQPSATQGSAQTRS